MAYGIEIYNMDGISQLNNREPVWEVYERGSFASGTFLAVTSGLFFVRPTVLGATLSIGPPGFSKAAYPGVQGTLEFITSSGSISYVRVRSCSSTEIPTSGYGLVVINEQSNTLCFHDNLDYVTISAIVSATVKTTGTLDIPVAIPLSNKHHYIDAIALSVSAQASTTATTYYQEATDGGLFQSLGGQSIVRIAPVTSFMMNTIRNQYTANGNTNTIFHHPNPIQRRYHIIEC